MQLSGLVQAKNLRLGHVLADMLGLADEVPQAGAMLCLGDIVVIEMNHPVVPLFLGEVAEILRHLCRQQIEAVSELNKRRTRRDAQVMLEHPVREDLLLLQVKTHTLEGEWGRNRERWRVITCRVSCVACARMNMLSEGRMIADLRALPSNTHRQTLWTRGACEGIVAPRIAIRLPSHPPRALRQRTPHASRSHATLLRRWRCV